MALLIPVRLAPLTDVCVWLRGKTSLGTTEGGDEPWLGVAGSAASLTCLRTMAPFGPDDELAEPAYCRAGRACFAAPADEPA